MQNNLHDKQLDTLLMKKSTITQNLTPKNQLTPLVIQLKQTQQMLMNQYIKLGHVLQKMQDVLGEDFEKFAIKQLHYKKVWLDRLLANAHLDEISDVYFDDEEQSQICETEQKTLQTIKQLNNELLLVTNQNKDLKNNLQSMFIENDQLNNLLHNAQKEILHLKQREDFDSTETINGHNVLEPIVKRLENFDITTISYSLSEKRTLLEQCDDIIRHANNIKIYL